MLECCSLYPRISFEYSPSLLSVYVVHDFGMNSWS